MFFFFYVVNAISLFFAIFLINRIYQQTDLSQFLSAEVNFLPFYKKLKTAGKIY